MADINELEKQISNLPIGYVIEKIINEKILSYIIRVICGRFFYGKIRYL